MRTKGALNKRTMAAIHEAEHGKLQKAASSTLAYLARIVNDARKDDQTRMQAANVLLPYLRPKLSAVEQTNINANDLKSEADLTAELVAMFAGDRTLLPRLEELMKVGSAQPDPDTQMQ